MSDSQSIAAPYQGSVPKGVLLGLLLHLLQFLLVPGIGLLLGVFYPDKEPLAAAYLISAYAWSVTQFVYLGPAAWLAFRRGERETGKGLLIVAAAGILLNGGCDAWVFGTGR
jgi:hypothetical protein